MTKKYDFEEGMQFEILTLLIKDTEFCGAVDGLIKSEYFENESAGIIANIASKYYAKYKKAIDYTALVDVIRKAIAAKKIRKDVVADIVKIVSDSKPYIVKDREYIMDGVAEFARQRAMEEALAQAADILSKTEDEKRFEKVDALVKKANDVGLNLDSGDDNYFEGIERRTKERIEESKTGTGGGGISTGIKELDEVLSHKGWGKKELSVWMGPPKSGKSFALIQSGGSAVLEGHNTLHITLENSRKVTEMRYDAFFSEVPISERFRSPFKMAEGVERVRDAPKRGDLRVQEYPSGQLTPRDVRRILDKYKQQGIRFDVVVVDYLDIMAPDIRSDNDLANHKSIWVDMRGIAQEFDVAMVTATQTNRTGATAVVARAVDVAESFDKIRTADLVLSLNRTDDEKAEGKARIYIAAGRNQKDSITLCVKQSLEISRAVSVVEEIS